MSRSEMAASDEVTPRLRIATGHDGAMVLRIDAPEKHRVYINDVLVSGVVATDDTLTTWKQVSSGSPFPPPEMTPGEMEQVDLRGLLKKYIDHIGDIEGSTCLGAINADGTSRSGINFTPDELATLIELESK